MNRISRLAICVTVLVSLLAGGGIMSVTGQDSTPKAADPLNQQKLPMGLKDFMRKKLAASSQILEGLATEDMSLVEAGAQELNHMSTAEKWRVHRDAMYRQFSDEFTRNTADLAKAAHAGNIDQAALKWMAATMNCIECHRYVRNNLVTGTRP